MFKLALTAGHYMGTPGKRCLKALDKNETREWWLNNRVADDIEAQLAPYVADGQLAILRTDDTDGKREISIYDRVRAANNWGADFYLSVHHNAGINGGSGGGIVAYTYTTAIERSKQWQSALYNALIEATGLKGNRSTPLAKANLYEVRYTNAPAVLLELGYMDSKVDTPIILTDEYAHKCATAIVETIIKQTGLQRIEPQQPQPDGITNAQRVELYRKIAAAKEALADLDTYAKTL